MRLKDLRWYILASIIIIISYAAISLSYYTSIKSGRVEKSMKAISLEVVEAEVQIATDKLESLYQSFLADTSDEMIQSGSLEACHRPDKVRTAFTKTESNFIFSSMQDLEGKKSESEQANTNYYFYFMRNNADETYSCARIAAVDFFSYTDKELVVFRNDDQATILFSNVEGVEDLQRARPLIGIIGENYLEKIKDSVYNGVHKVNGEGSVVTAVQFTNAYNTSDIYYAAVVTPTAEAILGVDWVMEQALIFFISGVVVLILMLVILILGCKKASQLLRADRHAVEATASIVIRIDTNGRVIFTNKTFKKMYGSVKLYSVEEFKDVETGKEILETIKQNKSFECSVDIDGENHYLHLTPLYISRSYYLMGTEITTDYKQRKHLEIMSGRNENTNCENAFMLSNQFEKLMALNVGYDMAFIEYNIDKYHEIISVFGRTNYVELLKQFLQMLKNIYKDMPIYHMTDSKFMVVFPNKDINDVTAKVKETQEEFRRPFSIKQNNIYVTSKIVLYNIVQEETNDITFEMIKTKLDLAYRNIASLSSKDFVIYDPIMDGVILAADDMEKDLEQGLLDGEFQMYLQPQFDVVSQKIAGFEALIRWMNPKYKDKNVQTFITLAEQRGHMLDIGKFVIKESFKLAKKLEVYGTHVSVNISPVQLLQVGFVQQLIDEFERLELKRGSIAIEITETLLMENFNLVHDKLKILREKGFSIHLDDFCTGYSSMLYLKDLPVDLIKIDKEFTKFIENNKINENICRTICNLATSLNLGIVCEGVETQGQSDMIKKMGCRLIQGYLISKAVPYHEAIQLIEKYRK